MFRGHTREHIEGFGLGMYRLRMGEPLELLIKVFNDFGTRVCTRIGANIISKDREVVNGCRTIFSGDKPVSKFRVHPICVAFKG